MVPMITVAEAASILCATRHQARRMTSSGLIRGHQTSAGWLCDEDSVLRWAASHPPPKRPWPVRAAQAVLEALRSVGPPGNPQSGENQRSSRPSGFSG